MEPTQPRRVFRTVAVLREVPWGSREHLQARWRRRSWALTSWVAFLFVVWFALLIGVAWLVTHRWWS